MASPPSRGSFDDVYRANGSGLLSAASSRDKHAGDDDADMSDANDAMSETSSLEIDDSDLAAIELEPTDAMDLLMQQEAADATRERARPASFHGLPALTADSPPPRQLHAVARAASLGAFSGSPPSWSAGLLSPRKRKRSTMVLHCHFAPAMAKGVLRTTPHPQLENEDDDLMDGARRTQGDGSNESANFARVEWANAEAFHDDRDGVHLVATRHQVVGTQLRVLSNDGFQLTTDRANWFLPQGHTPRCRVQVETAYLPQSIQVQVFIIGYVEDERGDRTMETLEKRTFSEALALEHAVYVRIRVGEGVCEGNYEIPVRLFTQHAGFTDEELSWVTFIQVRVANVALPPPTQWAFHLDLWQHHTSIARAHGGVPLWSDSHFTLIDRYFKSLAELGQKCLTVVATEMPWAGQQCYNETKYPSALFEHAVLDVYEDAKGELSIDFQHFDRLLALAEKHCMAAEIEVFGLFSIWRDAANGFDTPVESSPVIGRASGASTAASSPSASPVDETRKESVADKPLDCWRIRCVHRTTQRMRYLRTMAEIEKFITLFHDHCVAQHFADRVRVCADEPSDLSAFNGQMAFLERVAPQFQVKVALNHLDFLQHAPPQVVDVVPLLPLVCADLEVTQRWVSHIREGKQGRFCWYVCCGPGYPNQFVSSPSAEGELVGFLTHFLGLDGFLRWNFCLWPAKPWENLKWRSPMWKVGDMYFVLPGQDGFPVETLRYESMRFGVQSYELLRLAMQKLPVPEFERLRSDVASLIWRSPGHAQFGKYIEQGRQAEDLYSLDPNDYERSRSLIIDALALHSSLNPKNATATATDLSIVAEAGTQCSPRPANTPTSPRKRSFHGP